MVFQMFVKNLYVSWNCSECIAFALRDLVGESATEVLPALESLYLEDLRPSGLVKEAIGPFVAARQLLGHPVAVSHWEIPRSLQKRSTTLALDHSTRAP